MVYRVIFVRKLLILVFWVISLQIWIMFSRQCHLRLYFASKIPWLYFFFQASICDNLFNVSKSSFYSEELNYWKRKIDYAYISNVWKLQLQMSRNRYIIYLSCLSLMFSGFTTSFFSSSYMHLFMTQMLFTSIFCDRSVCGTVIVHEFLELKYSSFLWPMS